MKSILFTIFCSIFITAHSQTIFESDSDVQLYLSANSPFKNKDNGVTISFPDMATRMISNSGNHYFNPDITVVSRTRAVIQYQSTTNPNGVANIIVDSKGNFVADKSDMTIYMTNSYSEVLPQKQVVKQSSKPVSKLKSSQIVFESEANVLLYLTQNSPFINENIGDTLKFTDVGALQLRKILCVNSSVTIVSKGFAIVEYQRGNDPVLIGLFVDSRDDLIRNRNNWSSIYKASYHPQESQKPTVKQSRPTVKKNLVPVKKKS